MLSSLPFTCLALLASAPLAASQDDAAVHAAREAEFAELLSGSKLVGSYTLNGEPDGTIHEDSYTLKSVKKLDDGNWQFVAAIEFGGREIPIALSFPVEWAGDTPVLSVTKTAFPMLGEYSARVLFYDNQYVGVWSGTDYGGLMWGRVVRESEEASDEDSDTTEAVEESGDSGDSGRSRADETTDEVEDDGTNWPSYRGRNAAGVSDAHPVATEWDIEKGTNIKWRVPVAGLAHSCPVVWGDKLFAATAVRVDGEQELRVGLYGDIAPVEDESEFSFELHCYDKNDGKLLWKQTAWQGVPAIKRHTKGSHAASSPATDGKRVLAFFGTEGLYCYDMKGELLWKRDFGTLDSGYYLVKDAQWGFASSPILHGDKVIVQCDVQEGSFLAALDANTGETIWRTERDEVPTWSTPAVHVGEGRSQVICNGYKHIGGYDLETGKELWKLVGGGDIPVPTPIVAGDTIFITNAHGRMAPILAIDANAEGTIEIDADKEEFMRWSYTRRGNYMQTPLVYGEEAYFCNDAGILTCYDVSSGEELFRERIGSGVTGFTGSGVAADGKLYFASEEGDVHVVLAGFFDELAVNSLGEECMTSPAISEGVLYYRTRGHLVAIAE